jgi:2-C-methyl-D-erythritol 4-phosphate cytidylyltransferase
MTHSPTIAALIPAAGSGTRLGMGFKALVELGGKTLLERAIQNVQSHVDQIWMAIAPPMQPDVQPQVQFLLERYPKLNWVHGGETRQASVWNLLEASQNHPNATDQVIVHDAARPFLAATPLEALIRAVGRTGAATLALPCADTLVQAQNGFWHTLIDRSSAYAVQTPQGFTRSVLHQAHQQANLTHSSATDDAGLVIQIHHAVEIVAGDSRLFKITTPTDLELARAFVRGWDAAL